MVVVFWGFFLFYFVFLNYVLIYRLKFYKKKIPNISALNFKHFPKSLFKALFLKNIKKIQYKRGPDEALPFCQI